LFLGSVKDIPKVYWRWYLAARVAKADLKDVSEGWRYAMKTVESMDSKDVLFLESSVEMVGSVERNMN